MRVPIRVAKSWAPIMFPYLISVALLLTLGCGGGEEGPGAGAATIVSTPVGAISAAEAANQIGASKTVCGDVKSPTYARASSGQPTFLYLDSPSPDQIFTVVILGGKRRYFPQGPETMYLDSTICVTGKIENEGGIPQIEATTPSEIQIIR